MTHKVIILSDEKHVGKTTALKQWIEQQDQVVGFLSPEVSGKRVFLNIKTNEQLPMESENQDLKIGRFVFDQSSFDSVERSIKSYWETNNFRYLVIDEIGPLEIKKDFGFHQLLFYLSKRPPKFGKDLLLVVRSEMLDTFLTKYDFENVEVYSLVEFKVQFIE